MSAVENTDSLLYLLTGWNPFYGDGAITWHLELLTGRRCRADPTTFGRWLRRAGPGLVLLDDLLWHLVRARWVEADVPRGSPWGFN